jgi:hypothetical protein
MRCEKGFKKLIVRRCEAAKKFKLQLAALAISPGVLDVHSEGSLLVQVFLLFFCVKKNIICKSIARRAVQQLYPSQICLQLVGVFKGPLPIPHGTFQTVSLNRR